MKKKIYIHFFLWKSPFWRFFRMKIPPKFYSNHYFLQTGRTVSFMRCSWRHGQSFTSMQVWIFLVQIKALGVTKALVKNFSSFFFCRIFTELAETFLAKMLSFDPSTPHFAITILDNLLVCCGHPDYEIPDITFNFWYR